jgi:hypothetical protein
MDKLKALLNRLNGWQRIFVVYLLFIHLPLSVAIIAEQRPTAPDKEVLLEQLEKSVVPKDPRFKTKLYSRGEMNNTIEGLSETYEQVITRMEKEGQIVSMSLNQPNYYWKYTLVMHKDVPMTLRKQTETFLNEELNRLYWPAALKEVSIASMLSLLIAVLLYVFGHSIGWVFRGFFSKSS